MVHFRSRFTPAHHELINAVIIESATCADQNQNEDSDEEDATCTPADIKYPTD